MWTRPSALLSAILIYIGFAVCQQDQEGPFLRVTSILVSPYLMESDVTVDGNVTQNSSALYDGFIPDLLTNLSARAGFDYEIRQVADGSYGRQVNGNWTGMIGELVSGETDLAAAPLTITWPREDAVDFTFPFHSYGIAGVIQRPPEGAVYTIPVVDDLPRQSLMSYGTTKSSWIRDAFESSERETYQRMWQKMKESIPSPLAGSNNEGLRWVKDDYSFVFFLEEPTADYLTRRKPCDLVKIDTDLARREYALAVPAGSPWRDRLNHALEAMTNDGTLQMLKEKWFTDECSAATKRHSDVYFLVLLLVMHMWI